jgi:hypothetical protein
MRTQEEIELEKAAPINWVKNWLRILFPAPRCHLCGGVNDQLPMKCMCSPCTRRAQMTVVVDDEGAHNA